MKDPEEVDDTATRPEDEDPPVARPEGSGRSTALDELDRQAVRDALLRRFPDVSVEVIEAHVEEASRYFRNARVTSFLTIVVERHARQRIEDGRSREPAA